MKLTKLKASSGQVLIESIVAISIGVVGLLGFLHLLTQAIAINKDIGQQFVATYLAAEGIEVVKSIIDTDYIAGSGWATSFPNGSYEVEYDDIAPTELTGDPRKLHYQSDGIYDYTVGGTPTPYMRVIEITNINTNESGGDDELKVVSVVEWTTREGPEEVKLEDHFFDWRP